MDVGVFTEGPFPPCPGDSFSRRVVEKVVTNLLHQLSKAAKHDNLVPGPVETFEFFCRIGEKKPSASRDLEIPSLDLTRQEGNRARRLHIRIGIVRKFAWRPCSDQRFPEAFDPVALRKP